MSAFTSAEIAYLRGQLLGRLATVGPNGEPHVVPVASRYNGEADAIDIGGYDFAKRKKFRDVRGNPRVALVIDDVPSDRKSTRLNSSHSQISYAVFCLKK